MSQCFYFTAIARARGDNLPLYCSFLVLALRRDLLFGPSYILLTSAERTLLFEVPVASKNLVGIEGKGGRGSIIVHAYMYMRGELNPSLGI